MRNTVSLLVLASVAFVVTGVPTAGQGGRYRGPGDMVSPPDEWGPDLTAWTFWWEYNRDRYWPERGSASPARAVVDARVVPALRRVLREEENPQLISPVLLALARCGGVAPGRAGEPPLAELLTSFVGHELQQVQETATLALGLLGQETSVPTLLSLLLDTEGGRDLADREEVPHRTRAFAAFALGGLGERAESEAVRREIVQGLARALLEDDAPVHDVEVACVISLGMVPLATIEGDPHPPDHPRHALDTRTAQIDFLRDHLADAGNRALVRAHVPQALVRLARGGSAPRAPEATLVTIGDQLLSFARKPEAHEVLVVQSAVLALGELGHIGVAALDEEIRAALMSVPRTAQDRQTKDYALIALARSSSGAGAASGRGVEQTVKYLRDQMRRGKGQTPLWAAIAAADLGRHLRAADAVPKTVSSLARALRDTFEQEKSATRLAALALASAILEDREAGDVVLKKLSLTRDPEAQGYLALALGFLEVRGGIGPIQKLIESSKYKPELLQQAVLALSAYGESDLAPSLIEILSQAKGLSTQAALAYALGACGDASTLEPLLGVLENKELRLYPRAWAAVALGLICDERGDPWYARIAVDLNYRAATRTLVDTEGTGLLNYL